MFEKLFKIKPSGRNSESGILDYESTGFLDSFDADMSVFVREDAKGRKFVLGINYIYIDSKKKAAQFSEYVRKNGGSTRLYQMDGEDRSHLVAAFPLGHSTHLLGGVLIAQVIGSGVFMQRLSDGRYWLLAASDGLPISRRDQIVVGEDSAHQIMMSYMTDLGQTAVYGDCGGSQRSADDCWADVAELLDNKRLSKKVRRFSVPQGSRPTILLASASVLVLAAASAGMWFAWSAMNIPDSSAAGDRMALLMQQMVSEQKRTERQRRLLVAFENRVQEYLNHAMRGSLAMQLDFLDDAIERFPKLSVPAQFAALTCASSGRLPEQEWNCIPSVSMSRDMGLVPLLQANPQDAAIRSAIQEGAITGDPLIVTLDAYKVRIIGFADFSGRPWPRLEPLAWKAYVIDYLRHSGISQEMIVGVTGMPDMVVSPTNFTEEGVGLEHRTERAAAHVLALELKMPFTARSLALLRSALADRPAHLTSFEIKDGLIVVEATLTMSLL